MQPESIIGRIISEGDLIMAGKLFFQDLTFEEVVRRYADTVTGVCIMRLKNTADAEDCFQNVFCKLYCKSPDFDSEEHLKAWLIRTAINECTSYRRKFSRQIPTDSLHSSDIVFDDSDSRDISWALMKVPQKYRDVLYLHYCEKYKVKEISLITGQKENTIKSLLKRGRDILRTVYGGDEA